MPRTLIEPDHLVERAQVRSARSPGSPGRSASPRAWPPGMSRLCAEPAEDQRAVALVRPVARDIEQVADADSAVTYVATGLGAFGQVEVQLLDSCFGTHRSVVLGRRFGWRRGACPSNANRWRDADATRPGRSACRLGHPGPTIGGRLTIDPNRGPHRRARPSPFTSTITRRPAPTRAWSRRCCLISPSFTATRRAPRTGSAGTPGRRSTSGEENVVARLIGADVKEIVFTSGRDRGEQPRDQGAARHPQEARATTWSRPSASTRP